MRAVGLILMISSGCCGDGDLLCTIGQCDDPWVRARCARCTGLPVHTAPAMIRAALKTLRAIAPYAGDAEKVIRLSEEADEAYDDDADAGSSFVVVSPKQYQTFIEGTLASAHERLPTLWHAYLHARAPPVRALFAGKGVPVVVRASAVPAALRASVTVMSIHCYAHAYSHACLCTCLHILGLKSLVMVWRHHSRSHFYTHEHIYTCVRMPLRMSKSRYASLQLLVRRNRRINRHC